MIPDLGKAGDGETVGATVPPHAWSSLHGPPLGILKVESSCHLNQGMILAWQHGLGCLQQAACILLCHDLHFQPHQVLPPTSSTCTDFLCKIEQLNGLNKSDDKTLIAIFLPPSLKRAICRHLERYFIKQKRKQFRKFLVNLPPESGVLLLKRLGGFDQCGSEGWSDFGL